MGSSVAVSDHPVGPATPPRVGIAGENYAREIARWRRSMADWERERNRALASIEARLTAIERETSETKTLLLAVLDRLDAIIEARAEQA